MRNLIALVLAICSMQVLQAQPRTDEQQIRQLLNKQTVAWNNGNLDQFMIGYWHNDSLLFIGKSGVANGYANALNNYKRSYSDTVKMGKLFFDLLSLKQLSPEYYWVLGKWYLKRSIGDLSGHFTLLFKKIDDKWVIVADHSS